MRIYELTYLISPELKEAEVKDFQKKIDSLISKQGGVLKSQNPKKIKLAYPIQKKETAFLATFEFQTAPEKIGDLKKEIEKEKDILRFLLIKKEGERVGKPKITKPAKSRPEKKVEPNKIEEKLKELI